MLYFPDGKNNFKAQRIIMAAPKNNQFWEARSSHGRNPKFTKPNDLWDACAQYFTWVEENPLKEDIVYQGKVTAEGKSLMRAMTISGMCLFLDICEKTWANYRKREGFLPVVTRAEKIIYNQKFAGAAADLLNANIIARDLGLQDHSKKEHTGEGGKPLIDNNDLARRIAFALSKADNKEKE